MTLVALFLNTETGDMQAWASVEDFQACHPDLNLDKQNDQGDVLVETNSKPWGKTLGYLQVRQVHTK
jgi:hypothetical protein